MSKDLKSFIITIIIAALGHIIATVFWSLDTFAAKSKVVDITHRLDRAEARVNRIEDRISTQLDRLDQKIDRLIQNNK